MDGMDMSSQETPPNINEPYANNLITIIASIIAFLTLRHLLTYKRSILVYQPIENYVVNLFSYSFINIPISAILLIIALISAILPLLLLNVDLTVNSNRAGFLGLALMPFILSSTGKNSALSLLTGISSVRLNFIHRILATALFLCVTVHMACMLYAWSKFPIFMQSQLQVQKVQYGLAGYGSLCVVMVGSFFLVRKMCYEVFVVTHLFIFGFIGAIALHTPYAMRYFIAGLVCYLLNLVAVWFIKSHIGRARFHVLPGGCTKVSIRLASPLKQHSIGQHINLCIPSIGSAFQWHPFTITSINCPKNNNMVEVHVCARGNFTRSLYNTTGLEQDVPVFLNGPFGDSQIQPDVILDSYNTVVIALGGAGATFGIRLLRELYSHLSKITKQTTCTRDIYVVWSVRRVSELAWFQQELEHYNYIFNHSNTPFPKLHLKLHITGQDDSTDTPSTTTEKEVPEGIDITPDKLNTLMDNDTNKSAIKEADIVHQSRLNPNDYLLACTGNAGVFVCGPLGFNSSFKNAVASSSIDKSSHIQLFCQDFSY